MLPTEEIYIINVTEMKSFLNRINRGKSTLMDRKRRNWRDEARSSWTIKEEDPGNEASERKRHKHPAHLRGKAIGLFYAQRNRERRKMEGAQEDEPAKPLGKVFLEEYKKQQIRELLKDSPLENFFVVDNGKYEHVKDSSFKRAFLNIITGDIKDKLHASIKIASDQKLDLLLYHELEVIRNSNMNYKIMQQKRAKLPSYNMRNEILRLVDENQVIVVSGETGCGKTTQVGQFILDDYIEKKKGSLCRIVCTQPRRISAISVAERVADERAESIGLSSGYQIRLENKLPRSRGSICFCTTGVILKKMESDPCLSDFSHIILDEIHERDIMSDFLITLLKQVIKERKDLKVILMSATLNSEKFSQYYDNCAQINIPGFTYPVQEFYLEDVLERTKFKFKPHRSRGKQTEEYHRFINPYITKLHREKVYSKHVIREIENPACEELNIDLIFELLLNICQKENDQGAILVFLTGYSEISALYNMMEYSNKFPKSRYIIMPLHSLMATVEQRKIFERPPVGVRKIILSTNIAETSITIDDVVFVIDCGRIKMTNFNAETNTQTLLPEWVSLANANQRRGRAGRVQAGYCFHLFTKARNRVLEEYQKPEILRTRLEDVLLSIKILQLGKIEPFLAQVMDPPNPLTVKLSLDLLKQLNALSDDENLTPLGYHLAKLPIGPQMGKMILLGAIFSCLDPVLSVAASLDYKDAFQIPLGKEKQVDEKKFELSKGWKSDHLVMYEAIRRYIESDNSRQFCREYFLNWYTLSLLCNMKKQFMQYLYEMNFVPDINPFCDACNKNSDNMSLVKAVISAGLYPNVVVVRQKKKRAILHLSSGPKVSIHPKSVLSKVNYFEASLLVYYQCVRSSANYLHDATMVNPLPLLFFGDKIKTEKDQGRMDVISLNNKIRFKCAENTALIIKELRDRMNWFLEYKISHPGVVNWSSTDSEETKVLRAIMELITSEDMGIEEDDIIEIDNDAEDVQPKTDP